MDPLNQSGSYVRGKMFILVGIQTTVPPSPSPWPVHCSDYNCTGSFDCKFEFK